VCRPHDAGFLDPRYTPEAILEGEKFRQRKSPEKWLEEQLRKRKLLLVWDNFESVLPAFNGGVPLDPGFAALAEAWTRSGASRILVTSRDDEVGMAAWPVALPPLPESEGLFLLVRMLERQGEDRETRFKRGWHSEALAPVVVAAGGHALALELVAPYLLQLGPERVAAELGTILAGATQAHGEGRNQSLWASLEFSRRHLSAEARAVLPAVGLMAGGCLEAMAHAVVGVEKERWASLRRELERVGLVTVEGLFLKPHPVLGEVKALEPDATGVERFLGAVRQLCGEFNRLVRSENAKAGMQAMAGSETVVRRAIALATQAGDVARAWEMADSLKLYLELSGRSTEGARLMAGLHGRLGAGPLTGAAAALEREAAMARARTDPGGALRTLEALLARLAGETGWDTRFQRAHTHQNIAIIHFYIIGHPDRALVPLETAEGLFRALEAEGHDTTNRAAVLGDRANALRMLGRLEEARTAAEQALELVRQQGDRSSVARGLGLLAGILADAGRHAEAEARYQEALREAEAVGDQGHIGTLWHNLGNLALDRNQPGQALGSLRRAYEAYQQAGDTAGQMRVLNSLGNAESDLGHLEAAQAWYDRSLELALRLGATAERAGIRSNRAVLRSTQAEQSADPATRQRLLLEAVAEGREALALELTLGQPRSLAISHSNLANRLRLLGLLEEAREQALKAAELFEQIGDPNLWHTLRILEQICEASGDASGAADYHRRMEEARARAEELSGDPGIPPDLVVGLLQLALLARARRLPLEGVLREHGAPEGFLSQVEGIAPWLVPHLRALAEGRSRPGDGVPEGFREAVERAWGSVR
jgi:tetratricopeptide (TPR) repeat protein